MLLASGLQLLTLGRLVPGRTAVVRQPFEVQSPQAAGESKEKEVFDPDPHGSVDI